MAEEEKNEQKAGGDSFKKVYEDATYFVDSIVKEYRVFPMILGLMRDGKASIELKKRYMLRAIDETWVNIIEDTIPCLDVLIRNPSKFIEEREELMPIELSRNISPRSLQHLSQHTNLISKIEGDKITPSKILNVFREETIQTYENKFVNTLINRLYTFVSRRYEIAKKAGQDEKTTSLEFLDDFTHDDVKVKMQFKMEISESTEGMGEKVEKNFTYTTDLWRRVTKLYDVVSTYAASPFVQEMGHSYIRPPVMRTNAILKNKNLRQCLALWQFIESYESAGYSMLVQEDLEKVDDEYVRELYSTLALQYLIFRHNIQNEFDAENVLASSLTDEELRPRMVSEFSGDKEGEYDVSVPVSEKETDRRQPMPSMIRYGTLTPEDKMMLEALDAALDTAQILRQGEPERPPLPEPEPEKTEEELLAEAIAALVPPTEETADSGQRTADSEEEPAIEEETPKEGESADKDVEAITDRLPEDAEPAESTETAEPSFADIVASVAAEVAAEAAEEVAEEAADAAADSEETADSGQPTADSEEEPAAEEPAAEESVAEEPATEEPAAEESVAEEPATEEPAAEPKEEPWEPEDEEAEPIEEIADSEVSEEPAAEEPIAEEPAADESIAEELPAEEAASENTEATDENVGASIARPQDLAVAAETTETAEKEPVAEETPAEETTEEAAVEEVPAKGVAKEAPEAPKHGTKAAIANQKKRVRRAKAKKRAKALSKKRGKKKK